MPPNHNGFAMVPLLWSKSNTKRKFKLVVVQIMIIQFMYFFRFENYKFIIQRLWASKVLKRVLEASFFFSKVFRVSFMLDRTFQFKNMFLITVPNFPH